jgi:hypothetical protein
VSKKQIRAREERNRELAQLDRANRCAECKVSLLDRPAIQVVGDPARYCSDCYRVMTAHEVHEDGR